MIKRSLAYGSTKSPSGGERWGHGLIMISHQVAGYSDKELPFGGVFCFLKILPKGNIAKKVGSINITLIISHIFRYSEKKIEV